MQLSVPFVAATNGRDSDGMRVTFFQRRPQGANFSIERLFRDIRAALPPGTDAKVAVSRFPSRGLFRRMYNVVEAAFRQEDVNHVTGDVHYLTYLLDKNRTLLTVHDLVSLHRLQGWRKRVYPAPLRFEATHKPW